MPIKCFNRRASLKNISFIPDTTGSRVLANGSVTRADVHRWLPVRFFFQKKLRLTIKFRFTFAGPPAVRDLDANVRLSVLSVPSETCSTYNEAYACNVSFLYDRTTTLVFTTHT